jgi:hypothetical protein
LDKVQLREDRMNKSLGALIGGIGGPVAGGGLEALFRKTTYDINAIVIAKTGSTVLDLKTSIALQQQYEAEARKGGLQSFLAWKVLDYGSNGGGLAYGQMAQPDIVVIILAGVLGAFIGALAASRRGLALVFIIGLAIWGASGGGYGIWILGNVLGRAVLLIGGATGGAIALIVYALLSLRQL